MIILSVALLMWSLRMVCATAAPSVTSAAATDVDVTKTLPGGAVGVLFDPEQRGQQRNPHSIHDGDEVFFVVVSPAGRVRYARVLIHVTYGGDTRTAEYDVDSPVGKPLAWISRAVDDKLSQHVLSDLKGREVSQLGRACWLGPVSAMRVPTIAVLPEQAPHALIPIGRRPVAVVFRDGAHSLELQCDARADDLESDIAALLGELKLTW